jgi:hypothetical protein
VHRVWPGVHRPEAAAMPARLWAGTPALPYRDVHQLRATCDALAWAALLALSYDTPRRRVPPMCCILLPLAHRERASSQSCPPLLLGCLCAPGQLACAPDRGGTPRYRLRFFDHLCGSG